MSSPPCGCESLASLARRLLAALEDGGVVELTAADVARLRSLGNTSGGSPGVVRVTYRDGTTAEGPASSPPSLADAAKVVLA